ncbi:phosphate ABC transporter permease subunit PstC [Bacteroides sp.]|uniref:phosphate ABC transporter permease subunit PstC n=1 Tax=Bacteroides sp. TaxID=29523 RepID=UPI001B5DFD9D|nr:phosphate ABC transporter permease subunit PstC [Bacteroides sp.]MBP6064600.1 phosphate ABC transporter permease subunit PstC [Bacteroides sp.]MBP6066941.1 phosphate ABC transporter permease subunit PstC [Bacteroides sp.]MBP6935825.1 phosphate ABC transporter permease subunit PstC [Bacteroides sp.]MBP8622259.1 phosphate ABC transporter permease subunit PstC [Bacteroides sp.]MBP9507470.1 phosphate ABC transporter permease subunit PstC [Bacteroides sp.]
MKKILEKIAEGVLTCSGFVTSITIVLIIVFLFSQAFGLFTSKIIEDGYVIALNQGNKVSELTPVQIKNVFDEEITNWKEVGGEDLPIRVFRLEDLTHYFSEAELGEAYENAGAKIAELIEKIPGIVAFIPQKFVTHPDKVHLIQDNTISLKDVFAGAEWFPTATPASLFGFLPLITGTLWVSLFAILIALPFGLSVSIYLSEVAHPSMRNWLKPLIELLSGIPSVVYGFFGLIVIVPLIQKVFDLPVGESGLAGSVILAIMALPTIITVTEDAMRNCPRSMREASLALGASQWQTIYKVVIPYSISGITSGVVLGIGRAIGETMAVLMVTGNAAVIPTTILEPLRTIPATIAAELGEAPAGGPHYQALFLLGVVLFFITLIINFSVEYISSRGANRSK